MISLHFSFGDAYVCVEAADPRVREGVAEVMAYLGVHPTAPAASPAVLRLDVADPGPPPAGGTTDLGAGMRAWRDGDGLRLGDGTFGLALDGETGRGRLHPAFFGDGLPRWRLLRYVVPAMLLLLRRRRFYFLHAAALERRGAGVLLVAPSDGGKSTLSFSLVRQGWRYLSDDALLLDGRGGALTAAPFRRMFGLDEVAQGFFPELAGGDWARQAADEAKWSVAVDRLYPALAAERCTPRLAVYPRIVDAPVSRLEPVDDATALHALLGQTGFLALEPERAPAHLEAFRRLVTQCRHVRLLGGRDIVDDPRRAADLLEPLLDEPSAHAAA